MRLALLCMAGSLLPAQEPVERIYDRMVATFRLRSDRQAPVLRIRQIPDGSRQNGAYVDMEAGEIVLDQKLVDHLRSAPDLGDDAIAFVLGHELGHFYGHGHLIAAPGVASVDGLRRMEEQADSAGLLHSHLAGYRGAAVMPGTIQALYDLYKLKHDLPGYSPLEVRKVGDTEELVRGLRPLLPLFPLAITLALSGEMEESAIVLRYLADRFQSPDLAHTQAVLQARIGLSKSKYAAYGELYPLLFSTGNNLALGLSGSRGGGSDAMSHLQTAETSLRRLHGQFPKDAAVRINLALVLDMMGRPAEGLALVGPQEKTDTVDRHFHAQARAILLHHTGRTAAAAQALRAAGVAVSPKWNAFFRNLRPTGQTSSQADPPCLNLGRSASLGGSTSTAIASKLRDLPGMGSVSGDSYPLSVRTEERDSVSIGAARSHRTALTVVARRGIDGDERALLYDYTSKATPVMEIRGNPVTYQLYGATGCRFWVGLRDGVITEAGVVDDWR